jgi:hypothetical protein
MIVMAGHVPAVHVFFQNQDVDARLRAGHDPMIVMAGHVPAVLCLFSKSRRGCLAQGWA